MKTLNILMFTILQLGCTVVEPFEIEFNKGAIWTEGYDKFDTKLPGYHVSGDIATIVLRNRTTQMLNKWVLAITTSKGMMPPMLEGFQVSTRDFHIKMEPFNVLILTEVTDLKTGTQRRVNKGEYFQFQIVGNQVFVTFLPKVMALLEGDIKISWVDWYR